MSKKYLLWKRAMRTALLVLLLNAVGMGKMYAYDFSAVCETGQTLYYNIIDADNHYVELTCPGGTNGWSGFTEPTGDITLPSSVSYDGITYSVTSIGNFAFVGCMGITGNLIISSSVTSIGDCAFESCTGFTGNLIISSSIASIGERAFYDCWGFSEVHFNAINCSDVEYGFQPFYHCGGTLIIGDNVERIPACMFDCGSFTGSLTIPNSVTSIGHSAFENCSGFTGSLTIPNSVTSIGNYAFWICSGFTGSLTIGNSVTTIGNGSFAYCNGFTGNLILDNSITSIGDYAFYDCNGFTGSLSIGNSVITIGEYAFGDCSGFTGDLTIPNSVTTIGSYAFSNCGFTGGLSIGNSVTTIEEYTFENCSGFTGNLTIPNSVTIIGDYAFSNCGFTGSLNIGNALTTIGEYAFDNCSGFSGNLTIPNSVISIGDYAFRNVNGLDAIVVEEENPVYDSRENCKALIDSNTNELVLGCKNTVIPNSVIGIYYFAFYNCSGLTGNLTIPNSVSVIYNSAFYGCSGLTGSLNIPNSVTWIGDYAFYGCSGLTGNLDIPNSVTGIGDGAFENCNGFDGTLTLPDTDWFTGIGDRSFCNCSGLTGNVTIPYNVHWIGDYAFYGCSGLTGSLTIPYAVFRIGDYAFSGCTGFSEAMLFWANPPYLGNYAFSDTDYPIYVPYESLNDYKTAYNWSEYSDRIYPMTYTTIPGYGEGEGNYRFIASPMVENIDPTAVDNMITETPYDFYRFDQSEDLEWRNYEYPENTQDFMLVNGQGYLYANAEDVNLVFKGEFNEDETKEVELAYDANADFAGWNLVGNPFPVSAYADRSYYVMNEDGTAIEPVAVSMGTAIPFCTGMMVKADNTGETVTFGKTAPETAANQGVLQIAVAQANQRGASTGSATVDKAIVSFNAGDRLEKFVFNEGNATLSIPQGGKDFAIANAEKMGEMPLNFKAAKNGEYTITVNPEAVEMDYLHLIDNMTGADIDLLALRHPSTGSGSEAQGPASYTFEAKTTDYASRFRLVFSVFGDEDGNNDASFAFVSNGEIIITANMGDASLQIVDMMGRMVVSVGGGTRCVSTAGMPAGVYVLRLIDGDSVRTQKIVIE